MSIKWSKKDAIQAIVTLTSPFDRLKKPNTPGQGLNERLKELIAMRGNGSPPTLATGGSASSPQAGQETP